MNTVPFFDTILALDSLTVAANKRYIKKIETVTHTMKAGNTSKLTFETFKRFTKIRMD